MQFGICTTLDHAPAVQAAGWDYIEMPAQPLFQPRDGDDAWTGPKQLSQSPLPIPAVNSLLPRDLPPTGPRVDLAALRQFMSRVTARARQLGVEIIVFGSGGARNVPDGFDRGVARQQIIDFLRMGAEFAERDGVNIHIEALNRRECNIINSLSEARQYVTAVDHPRIQCIADSFHFWVENEPLESLEAAVPHVRHVHVADLDGRVAPGISGSSDYQPFFRALKRGGYDRRISVESAGFDIAARGPMILEFLKQQWNAA